MANPDQIKSSAKLMLAIGAGLTSLAVGIGIPVALGNNTAGRQTTARIAACTRISAPTAALACVESITGHVPFGVGGTAGQN